MIFTRYRKRLEGLRFQLGLQSQDVDSQSFLLLKRLKITLLYRKRVV